MRLRVRSIVFVVCALASPALGQDWKGMGRIEGRVLDESGQPIEGATVKLLSARGGGPTVKTNKKGVWAAGALVGGRWDIDVDADGYAPKQLYAVLRGEADRIPPVEVRLKKAGVSGGTGASKEALEAVKKGDEAYKAGRFAEARAEYERVLPLRPDLATSLHTQIARCYSQEGNYEKELEHLQVALDADPTNVALKSLMAQEALKGGFLDRGLALLKGIDDSTIKDPNVFFNIAVLLLNQQKADEAVGYLTKAVTVDSTFVDGYFQRALAYLQLQKLAESKADFKKVLELAPTGAQAETAKKALEQLK